MIKKTILLHRGRARLSGRLRKGRADRPYLDGVPVLPALMSLIHLRSRRPLVETVDRLTVAAAAFAVGAAAGVLLAPRAGASTREKLAGGARSAASGAGARVAATAAPVAATLREAADSIAERHLPLAGEWDVVDGAALARDIREGRA